MPAGPNTRNPLGGLLVAPALMSNTGSLPVPWDKTMNIDITPLWSGILPALIAVLQTGGDEGRRMAIAELYKMAEAADAYNETVRKS